MKRITIYPKKLSGKITPPESKSLAHRAIIAASLAEGKSKISNIKTNSLDILTTKNAMKNFGASIIASDENMIINGKNTLKNPKSLINCNESASSLRFLIPIALLTGEMYNFIGKGNLSKRPLEPYFDIFKKDDIYFENKSGNNLSLVIKGKLKGGEYKLSGDVSSQFITGLMFALPLIDKDSKIILTSELQSKGYIDLTIDILSKFGINIQNINYKEFIIKGNQKYISHNYKIENDFSQAAFYFCAAAIGSNIDVCEMNLNSLQGDRKILDFLMDFGAEIVINETDNIISVNASRLTATELDGSQNPDLIPILAVVAALSKGESHIKNIKRLRIKECDRLEAVTSQLNKIGANIISGDDYMHIKGVESFNGGVVDSFNDHRIAMSLAIAALSCKNSLSILNYECVKKSYPNFFDDFKKIGGDFI